MKHGSSLGTERRARSKQLNPQLEPMTLSHSFAPPFLFPVFLYKCIQTIMVGGFQVLVGGPLLL